MQTNNQFDLTLNFLQNTGTNIFLTGKAGTGKTTFLKRIKDTLPKRMIVVAPTGVAAINAGGVTIHSFFQLPFGPYLPEHNKRSSDRTKSFTHKFNRDKINILRSLDLLVIDEISMVRADMLDAISDVLRRFKDRNKPFGGVQLLLIGDLQQLAPVVKEDEWNLLKEYYSSAFFFDSKALSANNYTCIELTQVYRQADNVFVNLLNNIRDNRFDDATLETFNRRYIPDFRPADEAGYIILTTHNYLAQQINNRRLAELPGRSYTFDAEIKEDFPAYSYPTDEKLELKLGAQVMFVKNDSSSEKRYYNGKIGEIAFIRPDKIIVIDQAGNEITVEREVWENVQYTVDPQTKEITESIAGHFSQYPLKTAWAITIHKSQGLTFEHAIIDASAAFSHGQVYVALSRCKSLEGLVLSAPITRQAMIKDNRIAEYTSTLTARYPDLEQLRQARQQYFTDLVFELFDFSALQQHLQYAAYLISSNLQRLYPELSRLYSTTRDTFRSDITEIGERFRQQLRRMLADSETCESDVRIQERIKKGVAYFSEHIEKQCPPLLAAADVEIDNKETRKAIAGALAEFITELKIKRATLETCRDGFHIPRYLSAKAKAHLEPGPAKKKTREKNKRENKQTEAPADIRHPELYLRLKQWRQEQAAEKNLPAYAVIQQKALLGLVNQLPENEEELEEIAGIGKKILARYGKDLLLLIRTYKQTLPANP